MGREVHLHELHGGLDYAIEDWARVIEQATSELERGARVVDSADEGWRYGANRIATATQRCDMPLSRRTRYLIRYALNMATRFSTLVIDLDGTLLDRHGQVSEENCQALHAARQAGLDVLIASGRALVESLRPLESVRHDGLMIAAGGAMLCDAGTGKTLERRAMDPMVVQEAAQAMLDSQHKVLLLKDRDAVGYDYAAIGPAPLDPASEWWFEHLPVTVRFLDSLHEDAHPEATVRAAVVAREHELAELAGRLRSQLDGRAMLQHWAAVTSSQATGSSTHLLEIFDRDVNKWTMIQRYCDRFDVAPEHIIAIGDGLNDVEMIMHAGLGIAMENADPRVLAVADERTADHNEHGVARAIRRVLDERVR